MNIAEGYGRFFYKENKNFNYYSRGSAFESTSCLRKTIHRKLIGEGTNLELRKLFERYFKLINAYIKSIGTTQGINELHGDGIIYQTRINVEDLLTNDPMTH